MNRKRICFLTWPNHYFALNCLQNIAEFHRKHKAEVVFKTFSDQCIDEIKHYDLVYVWNGAYSDIHEKQITPLVNFGTKVIFCEIGWFPQNDHLYFDECGTNGYSELISSSLDWLTPSDFEALDSFAKSYRKNYTITNGGYIFAPLQLPKDTQISLFSPYKWMGDFIRHTRWVFRGKKIIFRKHPLDSKNYDDLNIGTDGEGDLMSLICNADMVYGINSTVLLEAALIGKPVTAIGTSFLNMGPSKRHALAALVARQVPCSVTDFTPWMKPGRGMNYLNDFISQ